jgi:ABC-type Fe3+-hydroxamate transport system substrate-binding protein
VIQLTDALGSPIELSSPARRIVSLVPSTTETVFALGAGERLVGVTRFCVHPEEARSQAQVIGGTKTLRLEAIRGLSPDLILANQEENREQDVRELQSLAPVYVTFPRDVPTAVVEVVKLGTLLDREAEARALAAEVAEALGRLRREAEGRRSFRFLYLIWRNPYLAVGRGTFIDALLSEAGGQNAIAEGRDRYPKLSAGEMARLSPEVIFLSSEPFPFADAHRQELVGELSGIGWRGACLLCDGELLSWHGARMRQGLPYLSHLAREVVALLPDIG